MTRAKHETVEPGNSQIESSGGKTSIGDLQGQRWSLPPKAESSTAASAARHVNQFATIVGTVLALVSIAGTLLLFVNPRFEDINRNLGRVEGQLASVETRMAALESNLTRLDSKFDAVGNMFIVAYQDQDLDLSEIETIWRQASND